MARILAVAPDLMFASRIEATLGAAGHAVQLTNGVGEKPGLDGVDLWSWTSTASPGRRRWERDSRRSGSTRTSNVETRESAEAAGVDLVVPRSRMAREMPELVGRLLAT